MNDSTMPPVHPSHVRRIDLRRVAAIALAVFASTGCSSLSFINERLNPAEVALENRVHNTTRAALAADLRPLAADEERRGRRNIRPATRPGATPVVPILDSRNDDGFFVGVAISGGGSRSANFAAACMFHLQRLGLLQKVDYISSVSGGSLVAAEYCLSGDDEWNPGTAQRRLTHAFAADVIFKTFLPWVWLTLTFTDLDRTDLLAEAFDHSLFNRGGRTLTFADLRQDRPRLLINATNLQSGKPFIFCNESFDEINADLSKYPIGHAVAASAAVPVLLHHVTLRDFSTIFKQYVHLIDGGVTDNLGVQALAEVYNAHTAEAEAAGMPEPYPHGAVIIVLDATTKFDARLSSESDFDFMTSLVTGAGLSTTSLLNRVSSATLADLILKYSADNAPAEVLRKEMTDLQATGHLRMPGRNGRPVRVVHLALSRVGDLSDLPFASFDESVNNIATYFNIEATEAFHLYQAADLLVKEVFEPTLIELNDELEGRPPKPPATQRIEP